MISGFAINGKCKEVLEYLGRMEESNIRPDAVTFTTILSACAHAGLVSEALEVISKMEAYGIEIGIRHYGCIVDLLGRAGRLKEAFEFIKRMPVKPNETVLGSMIGACWIHSDMKLAEQVIKMISADSATCDNSHNVLLSNIYAASEKWEIAEMIRRSMVDGGSEKIPGCSSIILRNSDVDLSISKEVSHQMNGLRQSKE
jgi:pentatricopeptide repeat protein